jgi:hypothetical protein
LRETAGGVKKMRHSHFSAVTWPLSCATEL